MDIYRRRHSRTFRALSVAVAAIFLVTSLQLDAFAALDTGPGPVGPAGGPASGFSVLDVETFALPGHLGEVKYSHKAPGDRVVLHVQDAHCNEFAQRRVSEIIQFLNQEYGLEMVNLEGGVGDYQLDVFTSITGREIRREVADYFVKKGELNGAEYFAVNNPDAVTLWGVEDKQLYLDNLRVYRNSLKYKGEVDGYIEEIEHILNDLKRKVYSRELLEIDMAYNAYKAGNMDFREYLQFLTGKARDKAISIKKQPNLYLLAQAMEKEKDVDFRKANTERGLLIDELKEKLSRDEIRELVSLTVQFKTKKIPRKVFYGYLLEKAREVGMDIKEYPALQNYIVYVSIYEAVDRTMVMAELDALEKEIKKGLYRNRDERELNKLSRNLAILKNIFAIRLTKNDYTYYLENRSSFDAGEYVSFIERKGGRYGVNKRPDRNVAGLDEYRKRIEKFYEYSFKRDNVFLKNLKFRDMRGGVRGAFLMTGGFHTENLCDLFREEGISYVSILPRFTTSRQYESPYFDLLAGQVTDVQSMLRSALARSAMLQVASRLCGILGAAVYGQTDQDIWKARVGFLADQIASGAYLVIKNGETGEELESVGNPSGERFEITVAELLRQLELSPGTAGTARTGQEPSEGREGGEYAIRAGESMKAAFMMGALPVLTVAGGIVSGFALAGIIAGAYLMFSPLVQAIISIRAKQTSGWYEAAATEDMLYSEIRNRFGAVLTPFVFSHEARHRAGRGEALAYLETMGSPLLAPVLSVFMVLESVLLSALGRTPWARGVIARRDAAVISHRFNGLLELEPGEVDPSRIGRLIQNPDWDRFLSPSELGSGGNVINPLGGETGYEITGLLGMGGMGQVFSASARGGALDGKEIAVKTLKPDSDPQGQLYFLREALLLGYISDIEGVVSLRDAGYYMKDGQRQYYIAMDKARGVPLVSLMQSGELDTEDIQAITEQLLRIIRDQHARNILNKDVKPENLIYDPETRQLTMIDLGIASYAPEGAFGANAGVMGTPSFMAPEFFDQTRGDAYVYSKPYDMFAVATTLYQLYTGHMPHRVGPNSVAADLESTNFVEFVRRRVRPLNDEIDRLLSYPETSYEYFLGMLLDRKGFGASAETALERFRRGVGTEGFFAGAEGTVAEQQIAIADVVPESEVDDGEEIIEPEIVGQATRTMRTPDLTQTVQPDMVIGQEDIGYADLADSLEPRIVGPDGRIMGVDAYDAGNDPDISFPGDTGAPDYAVSTGLSFAASFSSALFSGGLYAALEYGLLSGGMSGLAWMAFAVAATGALLQAAVTFRSFFIGEARSATPEMTYSEVRERFGRYLAPAVFAHEAMHRAGMGELGAYAAGILTAPFASVLVAGVFLTGLAYPEAAQRFADRLDARVEDYKGRQKDRQLRAELDTLQNKLSEKEAQLEAARENLSSIRGRKRSLVAPTTRLTDERLDEVFRMAGREDAGDPAMPLPNAFRTLHDTAETLLGRHVTAGIMRLPASSEYGITHDRAEALWQRLKMPPAEGETKNSKLELVRITIRDALKAVYQKAESSENRLWGSTERAEKAQEARIDSLRKLISGMRGRMREIGKELGLEESAGAARAANETIKTELEVIRENISRQQSELTAVSEAIRDLLSDAGVLGMVRQNTDRGEDPIPDALKLLNDSQISRLRELNAGRKKVLADIRGARQEYGHLQAELAANARAAERAEAPADRARQRLEGRGAEGRAEEAARPARAAESDIFTGLLTRKAETATGVQLDRLLADPAWGDIFPEAARSDDGIISVGPNSYRIRRDAVIRRDASGVSFEAEVIGGADDGRQVVVKMPGRNAGNRSRALLMQELVKMRVASGNGVPEVLDAGMLTAPDGGRTPLIVMERPEMSSLESLWVSEKDMTPENRAVLAGAVLDALSSLHSRNVIHRGVRPENVLYDRETGRAVVEGLELGIYSPHGGDIASRPQVGAKNYLPRQAIVKGIYGTDTDLFALGVTLYQMGHRRKLPFVGWEEFLGTKGYNFRTESTADGRKRRVLTGPDGRAVTALDEIMLARDWAKDREQRISKVVRLIRGDDEADISRKLAAELLAGTQDGARKARLLLDSLTAQETELRETARESVVAEERTVAEMDVQVVDEARFRAEAETAETEAGERPEEEVRVDLDGFDLILRSPVVRAVYDRLNAGLDAAEAISALRSAKNRLLSAAGDGLRLDPAVNRRFNDLLFLAGLINGLQQRDESITRAQRTRLRKLAEDPVFGVEASMLLLEDVSKDKNWAQKPSSTVVDGITGESRMALLYEDQPRWVRKRMNAAAGYIENITSSIDTSMAEPELFERLYRSMVKDEAALRDLEALGDRVGGIVRSGDLLEAREALDELVEDYMHGAEYADNVLAHGYFLVLERQLNGVLESRLWRRTELLDENGRSLDVRMDKKVVPLGDVHGELEDMRDMMQGAGLIRKGKDPEGADDRWIGGDAVAVQLGDVVDGGPKSLSLESYMYLRKMQKEARKVGGDIVRLLGNHEFEYLMGEALYSLPEAEREAAYEAMRLDRTESRYGRLMAGSKIGDNWTGYARKFLEGTRSEGEWVSEMLRMLKEDISRGDVVAAYAREGVLFSHGVVTERLAENMLEGEEKRGPDRFAEKVNEALKNGIDNNDLFSSPIFWSEFSKGGVGLFYGYIGKAKQGEYGTLSSYTQVVGHDHSAEAVEIEIGQAVDKNGDPAGGLIINVAPGMRGGALKNTIVMDSDGVAALKEYHRALDNPGALDNPVIVQVLRKREELRVAGDIEDAAEAVRMLNEMKGSLEQMLLPGQEQAAGMDEPYVVEFIQNEIHSINERINGLTERFPLVGEAAGVEEAAEVARAQKRPGAPAEAALSDEYLREVYAANRSSARQVDVDMVRRVNDNLVKSIVSLPQAERVMTGEQREARIGEVEVLAVDLGDTVDAQSVDVDGRLVVFLNSRDGIAGDYLSDNTALEHVVRHEFLERFMSHREVKELEYHENGRNAMHVLNKIALKHMSDDELRGIHPEHEFDEAGLFHKAAQAELASRGLKGLLARVRPGAHPSVVLMPATADRMLFEASQQARMERGVERKLRKDFGSNLHVIYYDPAATQTEIEDLVARELGRIKGFTEKDRARVLAYANEGEIQKVRGALDKVAGQTKVSGVIKGDFRPESDAERFSVVGLATVGLGLMEWDRARKAGHDTIDLELAIQTTISRLITDPGSVTAMDASALVRQLVSGSFLMSIKKIDYNEIRDYIEAETAVLEAL